MDTGGRHRGETKATMASALSSSAAGTSPRGESGRERGIDRVLKLLDFLHRHGKPIRAGELARMLDAPRSSTYEIVRSLTGPGLLETGSDGTIFFGRTLYFYGADYLREHDALRRGRDEIDRLAAQTGETSQYCMLANGQYTVVHMRAGSRPFRISSDIGTQIPAPWTASGRLLLSDIDEDEIRQMLRPEDLVLPNGHAIGLPEFLESVRTARHRGYCITSGLVDAYTHCIAAPVRDRDGRTAATLCFVVPIDTSPARIAELRDILIVSGQALSVYPGPGQRHGLEAPDGLPHLHGSTGQD